MTTETTSVLTAIGKDLDDIGYAYGTRRRGAGESDQSYRQAIIDHIGSPLHSANTIVRRLVDAMQRSREEGCTDHLDCCDDHGKFWYSAIEEAEAFLERK